MRYLMRKLFSPRKYIVVLCSLMISFASFAEETTETTTNEASLKLPAIPEIKPVDFSAAGFLGTGATVKSKKYSSFSGLTSSPTGIEYKPDYSLTEMYLNGDGNALGLYRASEVGFATNFVSRPCRDKNGEVRSELISLSKSSEEINRAVACNEDVKFTGYDDCSCAQYESCTKAVLGIDNFFGIRLTSHYQNIIQPYIGEAVGQRYAEKAIDSELKNIEETKLLRKYAEKIGVNVAGSKQCEDKHLKGTCSPEEIDGIIYNKQKACGISSKINCYNLDDNDYKNIEVAEGQKEIKYDLFLDKITENKAVDLMTHEMNVGNEIADLFLEKDKKKTTKPAMKLTLAQLKEKLTSINGQKKLDPVLAYVLKDDSRLIQFYKKMEEMFKSQKTPTQAYFKDAIAAYRKETLENIFSDSSCSEKSSLKKICELKHSLANSKKNQIPLMSSSEISNYFQDGDDFDRDFETYKSTSMFKVIDNSNEYAAMIKGYRCFMFKYDFSKVKKRQVSTCGGITSIPTSPEESVYSLGSANNSSSTENNSNGPDKNAVERDDSKISIGNLNLENAKNDELKVAADQVESAKTLDLNKAMTDTMNNNFGNTFNQENPIANNSHSEMNQPIPVTPADSESKNEKSPAAILEEKLRELTNKIAAAEQSLDKIKSGKKDEETRTSNGQSQDEMAKSLEAQIKQLKADLAAAKSKAPVVVEKTEPVIARNIASVAAPSIATSRDTTEERRNFANDPVTKHEATRESSRSYGDGPGTGASASTSSNFNQASVAQNRSSGLVLTKVDGLSSEAAMEAISTKIAEMAGQPFLIEEGGYVKEIVPVIKDGKIVFDNKGKPVFEKIIKGKVADLKFKNAKRAPASISSQAELRKVEEAKVKAESERLKYKNLRELTDEAVK